MKYHVETWNTHFQRWDCLGRFDDYAMAQRWAAYHRAKGNSVHISQREV